ncbi:hypothetical protein INT43_007170 [Umbelopsis isabellina]|uniref:WIBG Mago-binding domain-containing protein n=1 Tax=Mortierella isabellina TaxID=91625 RepID=A0A8H7UJN0_MORIS|nr:hypothetical protein INT43_007170 [Umbelopsis isabellina]
MSSNASGIVGSGEDRYIPGSRRPDGTYRKERKVRPGFTPAEDVVRYTNARMEASKPSTYPPGYNPKAKAESATNAKKSQKKKPQQVEPPKSSTETTTVRSAEKNDHPLTEDSSTVGKSEADKKIKQLQKKLRQIDDLKKKQGSGEKMNEDQLEKLAKAKSIEEELSKLTI